MARALIGRDVLVGVESELARPSRNTYLLLLDRCGARVLAGARSKTEATRRIEGVRRALPCRLSTMVSRAYHTSKYLVWSNN